jgi:L-asparaginase / beta-aspartyl-peptidase
MDTAKPTLVVHGGAGAAKELQDGCASAAERGRGALGVSALAAAVAAVTALEDDGRYNAGSGAALCLDGVTVEMDASVMDSQGTLGAVACLRGIRNAVLAAQEVAQTPHWLLAGDGAALLARRAGLAPSGQVSQRVRQEHQAMLSRLHSGVPSGPGADGEIYARFWEREAQLAAQRRAPGLSPASAGRSDTVGAVARDAGGVFAVACSTGGTSPSLQGRVGDTPIIGSGFYAGPHGAVAATGVGEHIVRHLLAYQVYGWIADGMPLQRALERGVSLFAPDVEIGLIAVSRDSAGAHSNRDMPWAEVQHG